MLFVSVRRPSIAITTLASHKQHSRIELLLFFAGRFALFVFLFLCGFLVFPLRHLNQNGWDKILRHSLQLRWYTASRTNRTVVHESTTLAGDPHSLDFLALFGQVLNLFVAFR